MTIGFIGLGEVGKAYSCGLAQNGTNVIGYDTLLNDQENLSRFQCCVDAGVKLANGMEELVVNSDLIIAVTTSHVAIATAQMAKPFLKPGQIYIELNSASPKTKEKIQELLAGIDVVDGATMAPPGAKKQQTLVLISGARAREVADQLNSLGMNLRFVSETFGSASGIKIVRSIFFKGMEAVLLESMHAAYNMRIEEAVFSSICEYFNNAPIEQSLEAMIRSSAIHAKRRGEEVAGSAEVLEDLDLDNMMSRAAADKLMWMSDIGMKEIFDGYIPNHMEDVLKLMPQRKRSRK